MRSLRSSLSVVVTLTVCCVTAWAPLPSLHAQPRDVRLLDAVKRRDQQGVHRAAARAAPTSTRAQPDGATALAWAVHLGERRMAEALLDAGANANTADEYGETPVTLAAANGDADAGRAAARRRRRRRAPRDGTARPR